MAAGAARDVSLHAAIGADQADFKQSAKSSEPDRAKEFKPPGSE
jgi:hypothetical protein